MASERQLLDGLLLVDKPGESNLTPEASDRDAVEGAAVTHAAARPYLLSSHDIVSRVRRWSGQRRIGHTGTLDPMASGLLILCLGSATRLVEFYQHQPKQYLAEIVLGASTDTYDAAGTIVETRPTPSLTAGDIDSALDAFRGVVEQRPPAFSAIKHEGQTLYARARRGEEITAPPRRVTFFIIDLVDFRPPDRITVRLKCSAGTYVRSLAHDLGAKLGAAAYLQSLRREAIGTFTLAEAHTLGEIETAAQAGHLHTLLLPPGERLPLPTHSVDEETMRRLGFGQIVHLPYATCDPERCLATAIDLQGRFVGVIRRLGERQEQNGWRWKAEKWMQ